MLVGHYAPALLARRLAPEAPLWTLFLAAQAVDILYFGLVFGGIEAASLHPGEVPKFEVAHGVWSHSLAMTAVYGVAALAAGRLLGWGRAGVAFAAVLVSHWLMDLVVHVPDLPLALDQAHAVGFGLWRLPLAALGLEVALVVGTTAWLARARPGEARRYWVLAAGLCLLQVASEFVIPLPPTGVALGLSALPVYFGAIAAAWWAER